MTTDEYAGLHGQMVLITGGDGMLGRAFREALQAAVPSAGVLARSRAELDVTDLGAVMSMRDQRPNVIVHCAGLTNAEQCERDPEEARRVHVDGTQNVVTLARACGARVLYPQSVFVFDGRELPVTEHTVPNPRFQYGQVKLEAERRVLEAMPDALVVRLAGFFGGEEKDKNFVGIFVRELERMLSEGIDSIDVGDRVWQPTYTLDHAMNCLLLLARGCTGVYNMGARGEASFFDVAAECVQELGLAERIRVRHTSAEQFNAAESARRPMRMVTACLRLDAEGLNRQRDWRMALREYLARPYFDRLRVAGRVNVGH